MFLNLLSATKSVLKNAYLKINAVIIVLAVIGLSIVGHYGISSDEAIEISMVKWNFELVTQGKPMPNKLMKYYGTVFNFTSEVVFQAKEFWDDIGINNSILSSRKRKKISTILINFMKGLK